MKNMLENTGTLYHIYQNLARVKIMNKQQKEVLLSQLNDEKAVLKAIEKNYKDALAEINSKIEHLMARHDADMQHVIYQVEYQKALKTQIQAILETLQANEFETLSEYLTKAYEEGFFGAMYDMQQQGIPLVFPIDQAQVLEAIQTETNLSETLYAKLGKDIKDLQKKVASEISRGLSTGMMMAEMARNIEALAKISKNNAMRIARTEAHRIQCKAAYDAQWKAKDKGANVVKQWDATIDGKTRDSHRKIDGEIRELEENFSNGLEYPGDPSGAAGEVINCRCALLQRARWNLENNFPKWTKGEHIADEDGTVQYIMIESKDFDEFKGYYRDITGQMTMNLK
jgi:SPP1 gp7 family putative phage head morphogenesis protein